MAGKDSIRFDWVEVFKGGSVKGEEEPRYLVNDDLRAAVRVAMALDKPLLLMGEPGTGKTQLAYKLAADLFAVREKVGKNDFRKQPLRFNCKSSSEWKDILYHYDAVRRFHDAHEKKEGEDINVWKYIRPVALGKAIALSNRRDEVVEKFLSAGGEVKVSGSMGSVVLIDEIDKAPKDFANALLDVLEEGNRSFRVEEAGEDVRMGSDARIVVLITSNGERPLPPAFLRRCVFYHIPFPSEDELMKIVELHFGEEKDSRLIRRFVSYREQVKMHKPATSALLEWLRVLEMLDIKEEDFWDKEKANKWKRSFAVLAKTHKAFAKLVEDS